MFAVMLIVAIVFAIEVSPMPTYIPQSSYSDLRILARDALNSLEHQYEVEGYQNFLVKCIVENDRETLSYYLNISLPPSTYYNIYISNGSAETLWYDGESFIGGKFGNIAKVHRTFYYEGSITGIDGVTVDGNVYEIILEVWRL